MSRRQRGVKLDAPGQKLLDPSDPNVIERCTRCGRKLRSPAARKRGLGRRCRKKEARERIGNSESLNDG